MSNCKRCGASPEEIRAARVRGNAVFYVPCGCDSHGDHGGCDERCDSIGCEVQVGADSECDHTRVRADNPNLVVNHILHSLNMSTLDTARDQAARVIIDLDKAGYKIVKK